MDIVALVALVVAVTQVLKGVIPINANIIAVVLSIGVVAYKALAAGTPFTFALALIFIQVIVGAVGAFKVGQQLLSDKPAVK